MEFPGALQHVMSRGNNRQIIFHDDQDYKVFLDRMRKYHQRYDFKIFAFVLMPNHTHHLIKTAQAPLSKIMQGWLESYALYYNKKHQAVGHLFQGRYKSVLCQESRYLLTLVRYIHNNPVRAGLCVRAEDYPWSSYPVYLGRIEADFIQQEQALVEFSENPATALEEFVRFMGQDVKTEEPSLRDELKDNLIIGTDDFIEKVKRQSSLEPDVLHPTKNPVRNKSMRLDELLDFISVCWGVQRGHIISESRCRSTAQIRRLFAFIAVEHLGFMNKDVAKFLQRDESHICNMIRRFRAECLTNAWLVQKLNKIIKVINV